MSHGRSAPVSLLGSDEEDDEGSGATTPSLSGSAPFSPFSTRASAFDEVGQAGPGRQTHCCVRTARWLFNLRPC